MKKHLQASENYSPIQIKTYRRMPPNGGKTCLTGGTEASAEAPPDSVMPMSSSPTGANNHDEIDFNVIMFASVGDARIVVMASPRVPSLRSGTLGLAWLSPFQGSPLQIKSVVNRPTASLRLHKTPRNPFHSATLLRFCRCVGKHVGKFSYF